MRILEFPTMFAVRREIAFKFNHGFVTPFQVVKTISAVM
jgi:hypothetical protein